MVASYVHNQVAEGLGKIGVLVALESTGKAGRTGRARPADRDACRGRQPAGARRRGLDPAVVEREKDVLADKAAQQGKPANVIEKIVESGPQDLLQGGLPARSGLYPRSRKSVAQAVKEAEGKVGAPIKIAGFVRYALGEGIERPDADFAAEVAAAGRPELIADGASRRSSDGMPHDARLSPRHRQGLRRGAGRRRTGFGIDQPTVDRIAADLVAAHALGVALGVVVGGGNILRGVRGRRRAACRAPPPTPWACWRP